MSNEKILIVDDEKEMCLLVKSFLDNEQFQTYTAYDAASAIETLDVITPDRSTRDDAAGEAYDKVARVLGLGYPGGPLIDKLAKEGDPHSVEFKRVFLEKGSLDFSFSGIKTGVLNYVNSERQAGREINTADVAAGFQAAVLDVIVAKTVGAAVDMDKDKIVIAGGVAANSMLRQMMEAECSRRGIKLYCPTPLMCTDNAAMIGCAAYYKYREQGADDLTLDAVPNLEL